MSKGPGRAQRFILDRLEQLRYPDDGDDRTQEYWLAEDLAADYFGVEATILTAAQIETIRRAIRTLAKQGLVETERQVHTITNVDGMEVLKHFLAVRRYPPVFPRNWRTDGSLDDLKKTMRPFGWLEEMPAIVDEHGHVIVGHRRLAAARVLRAEGVHIRDNVVVRKFGNGAEADNDRVQLFLASNTAAKPFTKGNKRHIAEFLFGDPELSECIPEKLEEVQKLIEQSST